MRFAVPVAVLLTVLTVFAPPVAAAGEPKLDGVYILTGLNPDGSEYRGLVKIMSRGPSFLVSWMFPRVSDETVVVGLRSVGVGIVKGGMFAVSYYGQDATGVALYQIEEGGQRLTGEWVAASDNSGAVHSETLTKLPAPPVTVSVSPPLAEKESAVEADLQVGLSSPNAYPCVDRDGSVWRHQNGIQVEFFNLGTGLQQSGHAQEDVEQARLIRRRSATEAS